MTENVPMGIPTDHEMMVYHTMAEHAASSKMYKGVGDKAGIMTIMLAARELGIPPMQSLNGGLNIINGKVEISARMMNALIRKAGHSIAIQESSDTSCTLVGKRSDTGDTATATFTLADAQKAGLVKSGGGWTKFPKDMCFARALSRLSRQLFADVIGIGYVEGEIQDTGAPIAMPDRDITVEPLVESEAVFISRYLAMFDEECQDKAVQYLNVVREHFGWSIIQAVNELTKDETKLREKFDDWCKKNAQQ